MFAFGLLGWVFPIAIVLTLIHLRRLNQLLEDTPEEVRKKAGSPWTAEELQSTYERLSAHPLDFTKGLPPKLERRYVVTGGSGLVGGYIVQLLLARGTAPENIRILDIRKSQRSHMHSGAVTRVDFVQTDISSQESVNAAFVKPWPSSVSGLPLTVFHTAAVIIATERLKYFYDFPRRVNVEGTRHLLNAARAFGADVFSATSSSSVGIQRVEPFVWPWRASIPKFAQVLDESDFYQPPRKFEDNFSVYSASKAAAERLVCAEDSDGFRTGTIRPMNGVYGNPTDNLVGEPLSRESLPIWVAHIVNPFVHGANVAIAHLQHEAVLSKGPCPQAGRPFNVTDPNPPITYADLYRAISTLSIHPFRTIPIPPVPMLLLAHALEWYTILLCELPFLATFLPPLRGDIKDLKPGIFSICTHLVAPDPAHQQIRKPVEQGGLGYTGLCTTMEGVVAEVLEWNREHAGDGACEKGKGKGVAKRSYKSSRLLSADIEALTTDLKAIATVAHKG